MTGIYDQYYRNIDQIYGYDQTRSRFSQNLGSATSLSSILEDFSWVPVDDSANPSANEALIQSLKELSAHNAGEAFGLAPPTQTFGQDFTAFRDQPENYKTTLEALQRLADQDFGEASGLSGLLKEWENKYAPPAEQDEATATFIEQLNLLSQESTDQALGVDDYIQRLVEVPELGNLQGNAVPIFSLKEFEENLYLPEGQKVLYEFQIEYVPSVILTENTQWHDLLVVIEGGPCPDCEEIGPLPPGVPRPTPRPTVVPVPGRPRTSPSTPRNGPRPVRTP